MKTAKALSFDERVLIEKYIKKGFSLKEISRVIGRAATTVYNEVRHHGGRDSYCCNNAQKMSEEVKKERYIKLSIRNRGKPKVFLLKHRIENLEMQVEILHETIKEILKK